ncbi:ATP-binding protein [Shewanella algae]|uniref:ATP-binding protein n=1 Tax=Shewanella algae TaxID=38313 RepID=UPI001685D248|nr:ATP-binding protein [Shewanella algae]QNV06446.1 GHKL domain-containing protein [Shewanella algae]
MKPLPARLLPGSLKGRLVISALLLNLVLLPLIGVTLSDAFRAQLAHAVKDELSAALYGVLALAEVEQGELVLPDQLQDKLFNIDQSGLYALVSSQGKLVWHSPSFIGMPPPGKLPSPPLGEGRFGEMLLLGKPHFSYSFSASFASASNNDRDIPFTVHIIKDQTGFEQTQGAFSRQLWQYLGLLMLFLLLVQGGWLWWTLKPLARFRAELEAVEQGKRQHLGSDYPKELQQVATQLNALISNEQRQRQRYRNALSDLAHSLKTPLAVLQSLKSLPSDAQEPISQINASIGHQLKRAQSAGSGAWHQGVNSKTVADKLLRTLGKIYADKALEFEAELATNALFYGDEADLAELLGNLLDNACKAANSQVVLKTWVSEKGLNLCIEDDGPGITEQQKTQLFERGVRADNYQQGHGIGLAIVKDLLQSYQGQWQIDQSPLGGARFTLFLPRS